MTAEKLFEQRLRSVESAYLSNASDRILAHFTQDARMVIPGIDLAGDGFRQFIVDVSVAL